MLRDGPSVGDANPERSPPSCESGCLVVVAAALLLLLLLLPPPTTTTTTTPWPNPSRRPGRGGWRPRRTSQGSLRASEKVARSRGGCCGATGWRRVVVA
jgi:hypothetical protein